MSLTTEFVEIPLSTLHHEAAVMKTDGWRFIQTHAVNTDDGVDLYYSFMKAGHAKNLKVVGVKKEDAVPSITDLFLAAFVFENEARELFGVDMRDIAIDFAGAMYAPAIAEPMTILTPEMKAARDKARKAAQAKAAKEAAAADGAAADAPAESAGGEAHVFVMTPERRQRLDAKLANMSPEKVAKVEAALKAREAEAAAAAAAPAKAAPAKKAEEQQAAPAQQPDAKAAEDKVEQSAAVDYELESKIALLDEAKAAKVRAAMAARSGGASEVEAVADEPVQVKDPDLEAKLAVMDPEKAAKVRSALAAKARQASTKGGE